MTDKSGYSLLDLFRLEVESQAKILKENLLALASNPVATKELEALVRATHAMKGVATIVELDVAIDLTQKMKDCFLAAQNQQITLTSDHTELLQQGFDTLQNISQVEEGELETYLQENQAEIADAIEQISSILTPGTAAKSSKSVAAKTTKKVPPPPPPAPETATASVSPPPPPAPVVQELPKPAEVSIAPAAPPPPPPPAAVMENPTLLTLPEDPASLVNTSMLELFRLEADAQTKILNEGLLELESNPSSLKELEAMMRAAHSIKGAARIVGLDAAVNLAHVLEDCFVAAQKGTVKFQSDDVDILLQGVDLIQNISQLDGEGLNTWMRANRDTIQTNYQQIHAILSPGSAPIELKTPPPPAKQQPAAAPATSVPTPAEVSPLQEASPVPQLVKAAPSTPQTATEQKAAPIPIATKDVSKDRVVMVSADNLNRIMGLAGETLIEAGWLQPYADSLILLKKRQQELAKILETLQQKIANSKQIENAEIHLKEAREKERECREVLIERINTLELYAGRTANLSDRLYREVIASNMRPFADGVQSFPRMVRDIAKKLGKQVRFDISGKSTPVDRDILKKLEAPLTHILRNAVDHGIEMPEDRTAKGKPPEGTLRLEANHRSGMLAVTISDDGKGINPDQLREKIVRKKLATPEIAAKLTENELIEFIFLPGFSTAAQVTEISGRGVGLDIAKSMAHEVGGTVRASCTPGQGMSFHFQLPLTLSVIRTLLVEISGEPYAFPLARIEQLVMVDQEEISVSENRQYFTHNGENIGLIAAYQVLELSPSTFESEALAVVVIGDQSNRFGMVVDKFLGERDLVVRPLDERLGKVQDIGAAALMGDGSPILIVDVLDLVRSIDNLLNSKQIQQISSEHTHTKQLNTKKRILVVDDSITVREMERKMLEHKGYHVDVAVDGLDGWNAVRSNEYDLIVSDIDMPRMNGIEFVSQVKSHPQLNGIPVIIVSYRDKEEHRIQGLEAGANYYLTKSSFQDNTFMEAIVDLIGN